MTGVHLNRKVGTPALETAPNSPSFNRSNLSIQLRNRAKREKRESGNKASQIMT